jgi:esterase
MELHFRAYGDGDPVVILHGLFGSLNNWHSHAEAFAESFRVFTVDQRNHGASPHSPQMTYIAMVEDLREFIEARRIAPVMVVGHSMGGRTAMQHAIMYPDTVKKLVVVDMHPQADPPAHTHILDAMHAVDFSSVHARGDVDALLAASVPNVAERQLLLTNLKREPDGTYRWKVNLEGLRANYGALLGPVTPNGCYEGPVLFLTGGKSTLVKATDRPGILALFPHADFREIAEAGHWVQVDAPVEFRRIVSEFLRS